MTESVKTKLEIGHFYMHFTGSSLLLKNHDNDLRIQQWHRWSGWVTRQFNSKRSKHLNCIHSLFLLLYFRLIHKFQFMSHFRIFHHQIECTWLNQTKSASCLLHLLVDLGYLLLCCWRTQRAKNNGKQV